MNQDDPLATAFGPANVTFFTQLLAPPEGMIFQQAVGTTFTLDLETALIPPLMVLGLTKGNDDARSQGAKLALNLRHAVERMTVFMEAGHLSSRRAEDEIHSLLAPMLREVLVPKSKGGHRSFHPKVWVVHYKGTEPRSTDVVRVIISSRNLTRSMSRDAMVMLEGKVVNRQQPRNAPIADFLRALPPIVVSQGAEGEPAALTSAAIETLASLLERTRLEAPEGFKLEGFTFSGPGRSTNWRPKPCDRLTVISPFCDEETLSEYAEACGARNLLLVSRQGTLGGLPPDNLSGGDNSWSAYVFDEAASPDEIDEATDAEAQQTSVAERSEQLHAKIFIEESDRSRTRITVGSGNATNPAKDGRNIEIYATLSSPADEEHLVPNFDEHDTPNGYRGFASLLRRFEPLTSTEDEKSEEEDEFDPTMRFAIYELLDRHFTMRFDPDELTNLWICRIECISTPDWKVVGDINVTLKPATGGDDGSIDVTGWKKGKSQEFAAVPVIELSPFVTVRLLRAPGGDETKTTQLVHTGFPRDLHMSAVMRRKMPAASDWLEALAAALGQSPTFGSGNTGISSGGSSEWGVGLSLNMPLMEALINNLGDTQALLAFDRTMTAFGQAIADVGDDVENKAALDRQKMLHRELSDFWEAFLPFLPVGLNVGEGPV
jgi:hypothetical protein